MAVYKTTYADPMNKRHTGYIIDGKTYKDKEGTQRIEPGSIVETADGSYVLTQNGGVKAPNFKKQAENIATQITGMKENNAKSQEAIYKARVADVNNEKRKAENEYTRQAEQQYIKKMESRKNINQLLKAQGINGGMSESMLLANQLAHEQAVNELYDRKADKIGDLDSKLLELRYEKDYNIATQNDELDKLYLQHYNELLENEIENFWNDRKLNSENFRLQKEFENEENKLAWEKEVQAMENQQFYDELNFNKEKFTKEQELDERALNHKISNDNRNYSLSAYRAYNKDDEEYERSLESAKTLASMGDYSGYAELFDWTDTQKANVEAEYRKKKK